MIRALIFDCFGVLYSDDIQRVYNLVDPQHYDEVRELVHATDRGNITTDDFVQAVSQLSGRPVNEVLRIVSAKHDRNEELIERIRQLRNDYKIGMLSNINVEAMERIFPKRERDELFDAVVLSGEVGMIKPDPEIYRIMARRLNLPTTECLFIDDIPRNVEGAKQAGMTSIVFTANKGFEADLGEALRGANS
ncbi:MAG TPA: HAD family phosphatase [Candidatus Saccharibacteria bacterium]|nr:HAD family phosphatase [Candidatus Saccharibacteria bacterium]HRK94088.1 HAD family phosphatase [Candidatus Saccharibacteria bacterium]